MTSRQRVPEPFSPPRRPTLWEQDPVPDPTACKHGLGECERCGTSRARDALHTTTGGRGKVATIKR